MHGNRGVRVFASAVVTVVAGVVVAGCTAADEAAGVSMSSPAVAETTSTVMSVPTTTTVAEPSTTIDSTTTTTGASEIPFPDTTGEDWERIVTELAQFVAYMFEQPDPALVDALAVPGSPVHDHYSQAMNEFVTNGWRALPGSERRFLVVAKAAGSVEDGSVVLRIASEDDGFTSVDSSGNIVGRDDALDPMVSTWVLEGSVDRGWRLVETTFVGPFEEGSS